MLENVWKELILSTPNIPHMGCFLGFFGIRIWDITHSTFKKILKIIFKGHYLCGIIVNLNKYDNGSIKNITYLAT